jgi:hypothetical protein
MNQIAMEEFEEVVGVDGAYLEVDGNVRGLDNFWRFGSGSSDIPANLLIVFRVSSPIFLQSF